jgi:hypothetical protein
MASSKIENDLHLPSALIAFELQIVKCHRLDLCENRVARRVEDFAGDVGFEVLLAERPPRRALENHLRFERTMASYS